MKKYIAPEIEAIEFRTEELLGPSNETFIEKGETQGTNGTYSGPTVSLW